MTISGQTKQREVHHIYYFTCKNFWFDRQLPQLLFFIISFTSFSNNPCSHCLTNSEVSKWIIQNTIIIDLSLDKQKLIPIQIIRMPSNQQANKGHSHISTSNNIQINLFIEFTSVIWILPRKPIPNFNLISRGFFSVIWKATTWNNNKGSRLVNTKSR